MVEKHAVFQGYYFFHHLGLDRDLRDQFAGHQFYDRTATFCQEYDQPAFDPVVLHAARSSTSSPPCASCSPRPAAASTCATTAP